VKENKIYEGTDCLKAVLSSGMTIFEVMFACKKCELGEQWSSDIAVSHTLSKCPYVQYANNVQKHFWSTPQTSSV